MNDEYQVLVSDFEIETGANFKEWLKDSGFKQIVDNFNSADDDLGLFNTRELLIDYVNDRGEKI
jgi:putative ubiquitin-RnfH superfamily antitoxin RatB of RatAB toxin-antitoxin module